MRPMTWLGRGGRLAFLALLLAGCASGGGATQGTPRGSADRIIEAEVENLHQLSAYEAVQRLRPRWLVTRTGSPPQVHVDGTVQNVEVLRSLRATDVQEMRFLNAADATTRFGTNYVSGVILVTTKRG